MDEQPAQAFQLFRDRANGLVRHSQDIHVSRGQRLRQPGFGNPGIEIFQSPGAAGGNLFQRNAFSLQ